ncbi:MAG: cell division protein FtsQ/DivIB [Betaproteobacteria bacterium]|nr:cell division protein FtsQ/DivIB [Betaproteobacteria bacterium]
MWDRPDLLNRMADLLLAVAAMLVLYGAVYYVVRLPVFALREVQVTGRVSHVTAGEVAEVVRHHIRGNFFTLDLASARAAFETLPWVRSANLRRHWPDRLDVTLEEHAPLARWGRAGLVSTHGEVFEGTYEGPLPEFVGPAGAAKEMAIQYEYFRSSLASVGRVPLQIQVSPRRAWQISLDGGTTLELGREQMEARLSRFVAVYNRTVVPLNRPIDYVDLRYANGFAVRIPEFRRESERKKSRGGT